MPISEILQIIAVIFSGLTGIIAALLHLPKPNYAKRQLRRRRKLEKLHVKYGIRGDFSGNVSTALTKQSETK